MTHSGVLATILSGLEPAVAIALACIPLMRPLLGTRSSNKNGSGYYHDGSKRSGSCPKTGCRNAICAAPGTFTELVYDNVNSSEVQLQPVKSGTSVTVSDDREVVNRQSTPSPDRTITVERRWEVRRD
jgi:hypothetical protein